jgi:hypothetical protein
MNLKEKIRMVLREHYGDFNSYLEHEYENKITENLILGDIEEKQAWVTYNQVILELKNTLKDNLKVKELQYKLTEDINPNEVCIQVIEPIKTKSPELERLYYKIKNF